jgi:hypothetical protein
MFQTTKHPLLRRTSIGATALAIVGALVTLQGGMPTAATPRHKPSTVRPRLVNKVRPRATSGAFGTDYYATQFTDPSYGFNGSLSVIFDGTHVWTANQAGNSLTEVDAATGALVRVVSGAKYGFNHPWTLAFAGGYIWVTNPDGNSVTEVNPTDGSLVRVLTDKKYQFNAPRGITSFMGHVWVSNEFGNSLTEIKASDGSLMRVVSGGSYAFSHPNTLTDDGDHVWVTNTLGNSVTELSDATGTWVRTISGAQYGFNTLSGITYINGHVWVSSWSLAAPAVTEINAADGAFIIRVAMPSPRPIGIAEFDGYVWVALWEGSSLVQLNETSGDIVHTYGPTDGNFSYPQGLTSDGNSLWVLNAGNASLTQITDPPSPKRPTVMGQLDEGPSGTYKETVSALISPNGLPTTYRAEWGTAQDRYDHIGPESSSSTALIEPRPTRIYVQLTGLPFFQPVHWRIVATNGRGTHYGVDETTEWFKFYGVQPQICVTHLQWQLVTADIIGPGCWVGHAPRVPQNAKLAIPPPAPYNPGSACNILAGPCPPPKSPPPPPPLYMTGGELAQIPQASGPIMTAIPLAAGKPVTVEINGTLITSGYVVADRPRGYIKANNASIDLAGSPDGSVPPTPIARHASISAPIPSKYGPIFTGAGLGSQAIRAHASSTLTCNDPEVQNAPLLGDFPDPSGIGAALGDLNLGGAGDPVSVHLINSIVVVCVDINLPMTPCSTSGASFGVRATLLADQRGLTLQDLYAHLDCAIIAGVVFQDVSFSFTNTDKKWAAQGTVEAIPGLPLTGVVEFEKGAFKHAGASTKPVALSFGFLRLNQVAFDVYPDKTTGTVQFGSIVHVPFIDADPLAIDGGYEYNWGANPSFLGINGSVAVFGDPIANGNLKLFSDGTATGSAHFKAGISGVFSAEADVQADYWSTAPLRFNVDGNGSASLFDFVSVSGEIVASDNGVGACVDGTDLDLGHFGLVVHSDGSVSAWAPVEGGCDISSARDVKPAAVLRSGRLTPHAVSSLQVPVAANTSGVFIGVQGDGSLPAFALDGPNGEHRDVAASGVINDAHGVVFHDAKNNITYVGVPKPAAGTWTVTAAQGSPLLTELRTGVVNSAPAVTAKVVHSGSTYQLQYTGPKVAGQTVQFLERGTGDVASIGTATGGGAGSITFTPHRGSSASRTLVGVVTQDGYPRGEITVGSYSVPAPKAPAKVTRVKVTRRGTTLVVSWPAVGGATGYSSVLRTSDGRAHVFFASRPGLTFARLANSQSASLRLAAVNGPLRGPASVTKVPALALGLRGVTLSPATARFGQASVRVSFGTARPLTITVSLNDGKAVTLTTTVRHVGTGSTTISLPLKYKGKPIARGTYTVIISASAVGFPRQGTAFALKVK